MRPERRKILLLALLMLCAGLVIADRRAAGAGADRGNIVDAAPRKPTPELTVAQHLQQDADGLSLLETRAAYQVGAENIFAEAQASMSTDSPPTAPVPATTPAQTLAAPAAPALPFTVIGKQRDGQAWQVFLARPDQTFVVREGDLLANNYQVVTISPPTMAVRYLPLNQIQILSIGSPFDD